MAEPVNLSAVTSIVTQVLPLSTVSAFTTVTTSTILPPSSPGAPSPASTSSLPIAHTSQHHVAPIAIGVVCGIIPIAVLLFMCSWRLRKPESFQKRRDQVAGWYNSVRQRCYIHNFGWGIGATWQRLKETRARNRECDLQWKASTSTSTVNRTGDGRNSREEREKKNVMQRWRKKQEQEMEERRERRRAMNEQIEELDKEKEEREQRWRERFQNPTIMEAEAEWEQIKRKNWERYKELEDETEKDAWGRNDMTNPDSEAGTTLAGSRMRRSDGSEESWVEKWRRMGEELPLNPHERCLVKNVDEIHPAMRQ